MSAYPADDLGPVARRDNHSSDHSARAAVIYYDVCMFETIRLAYECVAAADPRSTAMPASGAEELLRQLSADLCARTYRPGALQGRAVGGGIEDARASAVRDQVVQVALATALARAFPHTAPCEPVPARAAEWVATAIRRGLTRAFVMDLNACFDVCPADTIRKLAQRQVDDSDLLDLLGMVLLPSGPADTICAPLAEVLANAVYRAADQTLGQLRMVGRDGAETAVGTIRLGSELVLLVDRDPRHDWVLPAARDRLAGDLAPLGYDLRSATIQSLDLAGGGRLRAFGFEFQVGTRDGERTVTYCQVGRSERRVKATRPGGPGSQSQRSRHLPGAALARRCWSRVRVPLRWYCHGVTFPFRWLLAAALAVHSVKLSWHTFVVVLVGFYKATRRRWLELGAGACGLMALAMLSAEAHDVYALLSREVPAPRLPPGFYNGRFNPDPPWGTDVLPYGLYVPPHVRREPGPFPLVVYLHGNGERTPQRIFGAGVPRSIFTQFGEGGPSGRFEFIALFPIDPTGRWQPGTPEVDDAMRVVDHVIRQHRIDPGQVYLTGLSNGGSGVWRLAEAYPERWAAVAPVSSFYQPHVPKVKHVPAWIYQGAKDQSARPEPNRALAEALRRAGADVRYTEYPNGGHVLREPFDSRDLYEWFATKRKRP